VSRSLIRVTFAPNNITSLVLANTEELHEKIERLCARIRDLEVALRTLQSHFSDSPHPLLQEALLTLKSPDSMVLPTTSMRESPIIDEDGIVDDFGTLTIGSSGETEFLGKTARSDVCSLTYLYYISPLTHLSVFNPGALCPFPRLPILPNSEKNRPPLHLCPSLSPASPHVLSPQVAPPPNYPYRSLKILIPTPKSSQEKYMISFLR
jgi:hypothetical protein